MTKLQKIKDAVRGGAPVHEGAPDGGYIVRCFSYHGHSKTSEAGEQWLITFAPTGYCIGLTWRDEKTLNGKHFFLHGQEILDDPEGDKNTTQEILDDPCEPSKSLTSGEESTGPAANSIAG